jgi:hypothetical protein
MNIYNFPIPIPGLTTGYSRKSQRRTAKTY